MLSPRLTNCPECANIPSLLKKIDCKLAELGNGLYNNISYMLNQTIPAGDILQLIAYRRILTHKYCNPDYVHNYSVQMIASRVIRLTAGCISRCNEPERCLEEPCDITIVANPTTTSTSTLPASTTTTTSTTVVPATTTTTTTINLSECTTFVTFNNRIGYYNFDTNDIPILYVEGYGSFNDIANTQNKLWLAHPSKFIEYDITFSPWSISFNRDIIANQYTGAGLVAIDNTNLIGSYNHKLINIDISGSVATYTDLVTLPTFGSNASTYVSGDILLTSTGKLLCTVFNLAGETRLLQYEYPAMVLEIMVDIYPTITGPYGLTENNGNIYIFNVGFDTNTLFSVSQTYPYTLTPEVENIDVQINGASIYTNCATSNLLTTTTSSSTTAIPTTTTTTTV